MFRLAAMAFGAALILAPAFLRAQTPQPAQPAKPVKAKAQASPANPHNPGGNNSGYNGSQTGVTDAAATVGAATDNNSQSTTPNPSRNNGAATPPASGAYNGSQTGVTSGAGTIEAAPLNAGPQARDASGSGAGTAPGPTTAGALPNLSGTWTLNVEKSSWGKKAKPQSVVVNVEHSQPQLKYSGTATDTDGNQTSFDLDAAIDAREHPVKTSYGPGKITLKRINAYTITSDFRSDDGKFTETATTAVSRDGHTLTRRMHTEGPDGDASWTEVYDRK